MLMMMGDILPVSGGKVWEGRNGAAFRNLAVYLARSFVRLPVGLGLADLTELGWVKRDISQYVMIERLLAVDEMVRLDLLVLLVWVIRGFGCFWSLAWEMGLPFRGVQGPIVLGPVDVIKGKRREKDCLISGRVCRCSNQFFLYTGWIRGAVGQFIQ